MPFEVAKRTVFLSIKKVSISEVLHVFNCPILFQGIKGIQPVAT